MNMHTASCFDCRYPLDALQSQTCPECGREFDPDDVGTFNRVLSDPVKLTALPTMDAVKLRLQLERKSIPTALQEQTGGVIAYAPISESALFVNRSDVQAARVIQNATKDAGDTSAELQSDWTCPGCGEHVDAPFDSCWNCGADREAQDSSES